MKRLILILMLLSSTAWADSELSVDGRTGAGHVIYDESTKIQQRAGLSFAGVGVSVADTSGKTVVTVDSAASLSDTAYDATTWNANTDGATKNALRDKFEALGAASPFQTTSNVANLVTASDHVTIGSTVDLATLGVDGLADNIQFYVDGFAGQTSALATFKLAGVDRVTLNADGSISQAASSAVAAYIDMSEDTDDGTNKTTIQVQAMASDITLTLPAAQGAANTFLTNNGSGSLTWGNTLTLNENSSIALDPAGSADGKYSGITVTGTGGATIAFGDLVTLDKDDSRWELVDISVAAAATGDARGVLGIAVTSSSDGAAITVLLHGIVRADTNFPTLTIGAPIYASTTGDIVVTQPVTADYVIRIIGAAMTADELYFSPDNTWTTHT